MQESNFIFKILPLITFKSCSFLTLLSGQVDEVSVLPPLVLAGKFKALKAHPACRTPYSVKPEASHPPPPILASS
jgi:hypothetical protein